MSSVDETQWWEWGGEVPVLIDIRKLDDEILALVILQAAGDRGYDNYFSEEEHTAIMGLGWRRGFLNLNDNEIDRSFREGFGELTSLGGSVESE